MFRRRPSPENIRITKVGLWYVLLTLTVAAAATNTGNNALYMVLATMLSVLIASGILSRHNLAGLSVSLSAEGEVFANRPFSLDVELRSRSRLLPRWLLLVTVGHGSLPLLVPYLPRRGTGRGRLDVIVPRRGRHRVGAVHLASIFPLGFFRKGMRHPTDVELLVFPELFAAGAVEADEATLAGEKPGHLPGWGHELHALRGFRAGDDPRGIHWKQTARTGQVVFMERETEEGRRLCIVFDNAVGELADPAERQRFERLVSEAATTAVEHLAHGYEVELVTRDRHVPPGGGGRQRVHILEELALLENRARDPRPLIVERGGRVLRLAMTEAAA